jgi:murein tripeptide amidase MpaA
MFICRLIDEERSSISNQPRAMTWTQYHTLDSIYSWLDEIIAADGRVSGVVGGTTFENRQIRGVKITFSAGKPVVFVECGIHAREWISPATCTFLINELLASTNAAFRRVANSFEWHIFPSTNPDGYVFTHTTVSLTNIFTMTFDIIL